MDDTQKISFTVNGQVRAAAPGVTLLSYLQELGVNLAEVVAEHNGNIVKPDSFGRHEIKSGDTVEFIHFVGGG